MKKETVKNKDMLLYGLIGLMAGVTLTWLAIGFTIRNDQHSMMRMMDMHTQTGKHGQMYDKDMGMDDMSGMLRGKTGDDFDQAFIEQMIVHHQGAIDMANLAKQNAKHDEVKKMADDIISEQSKEIDMMQAWQKDWGYKDVPQSHMMQ